MSNQFFIQIKYFIFLRKYPHSWENKALYGFNENQDLFTDSYLCLLPNCPYTLFIIYLSTDPASFSVFLTTLMKDLYCDSLTEDQWSFLQNSTSFFFFSDSFILKAINKIIIWLLFLFWGKFTQILKLNMCNLSCGGFKVVFYGIDLIKRADRLISLKFVFMYLYSMRHYRLTKFILELIPFDKMILIRA